MGATSKVVRGTADWTQSGLTLGTSASASTGPSLCGGGGRVALQHMACGNTAVVEGLDVTLVDPAVQCTQIDLGGLSDASA